MKLVSSIFVMLVLLCTVYAFAQKQPNTVNPVHLEAGADCVDCHGVEVPEKRAPQGPCIDCHSNKTDSEPITFKDDLGNSYTVSPHASHAGQMRCTICHKMHSESTLYCNEGCHHKFDLKVP